jgi:hypothetical protein
VPIIVLFLNFILLFLHFAGIKSQDSIEDTVCVLSFVIQYDVIYEGYAAHYTAALATVDTGITRAKGTEKEMLGGARAKLIEVNGMNFDNKHAVQRRTERNTIFRTRNGGRSYHSLRHLFCLYQRSQSIRH